MATPTAVADVLVERWPRPDGAARSEAGPAAARIAALATAVPRHVVAADQVAAALPRIWPHLERRLGPVLRQQGGGRRHFARTLEEMATGLPLGEQTVRYAGVALDLVAEAAEAALAGWAGDAGDIGLLVVASCTGFVLPGLDARLVERLGLRADVVRMPFTHLGCSGGAAGLARAADWVRGGSGGRGEWSGAQSAPCTATRAALVAAVELPSLTFRPGDTSIDNLLSALVFGDGAGAAVVELAGTGATTAEGASAGGGLWAIGRVHGELVPGTAGALGYAMADDGFRVILSRSLPALIERELADIVHRFLGAAEVSSLDAVAAHPGGPTVLAAIQRALHLRDAQLAASWAAFRAVGNTSSSAIFFVLDELARMPPSSRARALAIAFGPGLSVELLELRWPG